ncbi:hypothetical protein CHUAL_005947 [Chamberlinius hualienensis]
MGASISKKQKFKKHHQNGVRFLESDSYDKAEVSFAQALKINPNDPATLCQLALVYMLQKKFDEAIFVSRHANKLHPNLPYTYATLGEALKDNNELSEAEKCFEKALQLLPQHFNYIHSLALIKQQLGLNEEAIQLFRKAIKIKPEVETSYYDLAVILQKQGKLQEALSYFKEAVRIKPSFMLAYMNMGSILMKLDDLNGSVDCYKLALKINPNSAGIHNCLGSALMFLEKYEEAYEHFQKSIDQKDVNLCISCCNMGQLLIRMDKFKDSLVYCKRAIEIDPKYVDGHSQVAVAFEKLNDFENAMKHHKIAIELDPSCVSAHHKFGTTFKAMGDFESAEKSFETVLKLNPNYANAYLMIADMRIKIRKYEEAAANYKKAFILLKYTDDKVTEMFDKVVCKEVPDMSGRKLQLIEKGTFGEVYLTSQFRTGHKFAIKIIKISEKMGKELLTSEIYAMKAAFHKNLVGYVDSYLVGQDLLWMVMNLEYGAFLSTFVSQCEMKEKQIRHTCKEILQGLKFMHLLGSVHCDIKCGTIWMGINGQVKIADFGLCAQVAPEVFRDASVETFYWKAPEIIRSEKYGNKVDVWSFGIVIIEMIDGKPPIDAVAKMMKNDKVTASRSNRVSVDCHYFLDNCLQIDPSKRASAVELLEHKFLSDVNHWRDFFPVHDVCISIF